MAIAPITVPAELHALEAVYAKAGHKLWLVGGCVRDHIMGLTPKDIDLATTATPDEQIALCDAAGYRWFGTGLQHGTITVLAGGEPYEITTLRTDVSCDGRHAEVEWASDIVVDLERRDLTINAIAMTLAGEVIDPFGGVEDSGAARVPDRPHPDVCGLQPEHRVRDRYRTWRHGNLHVRRPRSPASCPAHHPWQLLRAAEEARAHLLHARACCCGLQGARSRLRLYRARTAHCASFGRPSMP